ncbi:MAG: hypothetical protein JW966_02565 [Anaerolineae bacterium]|nr:hypothetical protein [Anaerolineae bacterium]
MNQKRLRQGRWYSTASTALLCVVLLLLPGCSALNGGTERQIITYEESLRQEADWLWNNMNYALTHYKTAGSYCADITFKHHPVKLSESERKKDAKTAGIVDHLDYAARMIKDAHQRWTDYCSDKQTSGPASYMETRLRLAYDSLNQVRISLSEPVPQPGSG